MKVEFDPLKIQSYLPTREYKGGIIRRSVVLITQDCELSIKYKEPVYIFAESQCSEDDNFCKHRVVQLHLVVSINSLKIGLKLFVEFILCATANCLMMLAK